MFITFQAPFYFIYCVSTLCNMPAFSSLSRVLISKVNAEREREEMKRVRVKWEWK